jgi:hypothetical protein
MVDVIWLGVWVAVTASGIAIIAGRWSRTWVAAGIGCVLGGVGFSVAWASSLLGAFDPPAEGNADEVAAWFGGLGFLFLVAAAVLTLIAIGRRGRRRFLIVWAAATLAIATYQFWTTNWPARYADTATWCSDTGHEFAPGHVQRIPPGVQCADGFASADGISWLALGGWSLFYGFVVSFPIMGLAWAARRLRPPYRPDLLGHRPL